MSPWCLAVDVLLQTCQARARDSTVKVSQRGDTEIVRQTPQFGRRIRPIVRLGYARQHVGRTSAKNSASFVALRLRRFALAADVNGDGGGRGKYRTGKCRTKNEGVENAGPENVGLKMRDWKLQDCKM